jgi:hypothetical protein
MDLLPGDLVASKGDGNLGEVVEVNGVVVRVRWRDPALGEFNVFRSTITKER